MDAKALWIVVSFAAVSLLCAGHAAATRDRAEFSVLRSDASTTTSSTIPSQPIPACPEGQHCLAEDAAVAVVPVTFRDVRSGSANKSATITTSTPAIAAAGDFYIAAITFRPKTIPSTVNVSSVAGLGLTWSQVAFQCAGRGETFVAVWRGAGTPTVSGAVTATLSTSIDTAVIVVARYSGADLTAPIGSVVRANTRGAAGACSGGTDTASYALPLTLGSTAGIAWSAVATRTRNHTPGAGFVERAEVHNGGNSANASALALEEQSGGSGPGAVSVTGALSGVADWAAVALELKPRPPGACLTNADCDDAVACTADTCNSGTSACAHTANNSACNDNVYCNGAETCDVTLGCRPGAPVACGDAVDCTVDSCNEAADRCDHTPSSAACSDGFYCTGIETCDAALGCRAGVAVDCGDSVACTTDACNELTDSCDHTPHDADCDNGLYCDGVEICDALLGCRAGTPVSCADSVACTVDTCNEATDGCEYVAGDAACDDGLYCNGSETCDPLAGCRTGTAVACEDFVACTTDACNESTDSCDHTPVDAACSDGLYCNGVETCDALAGCQAGAAVSCGDSVACTADACNEGTDSCDHTADEGACNDGIYCNGVEACDVALGCRPGAPVDCSDGIACTADSCDEAGQSCNHAPNDAACDDDLYCNGAETCVASVGCVSGTPVTCGDADECTLDICDENGDECSHAVRPCDDGLYCNGAETCDSAVGCVGGTPVACDDGIDCTVDACDEDAQDCGYAPDDGPCDDGLYCDGAEICDSSLGCVGGSPPECDDAVACTVDECDEVTEACTHSEDDAACDDGLYCSGTESCDAAAGCLAGTDPCGQRGCDETSDACLIPLYAEAPARGYRARACGFDRDGDGESGEPADDCNVCDGAATDHGQAQIYVDCSAGDNANPGTAALPKLTITAARQGMASGTIICFTGACTDVSALSLPSGQAGVYTVAPRASEVRAFQYPLRPSMVAGWDRDDDGCYPPFDDGSPAAIAAGCSSAADAALIDGTNTKATCFDNSLAASRLELAHFSVARYAYLGNASAATFFRNNFRNQAHIFLHDLDLGDMYKDSSEGFTLSNVLGHKNLDWFSWENVRCSACGGSFWLLRGGAGNGTGGLFSDNWRFENITYLADVGWSSEPNLYDTWGAVNGLEVLDSVFDCNPEKFDAGASPGCTGAAANACMKDVDIINNEFRDFRVGLVSEVADSASLPVCAELNRPTDYVNIERNAFLVPQASIFSKAVYGIEIRSGQPCGGVGESPCTAARPLETIRNLTVRNNLLVAGGKGFRSALFLDGSHESTCPGGNDGGVWKILHNTVATPLIDSSTYGIMFVGRSNAMDCGPTTFDVEGNLFGTNDTVRKTIDVDHTSHVTSWTADRNAYSPGARFQWKTNSVTPTLAVWQSQSGGDVNAPQCVPLWHETGSTAMPAEDGRLGAGDTCAADRALPHADVPIDVDTQVRGPAPDIGYDEIAVPLGN